MKKIKYIELVEIRQGDVINGMNNVFEMMLSNPMHIVFVSNDDENIVAEQPQQMFDNKEVDQCQ